MNIWIDLANSPHVVFFEPIIRMLENKGHKIFVSMRSFAQTVPLAHRYGIQGEIIGQHGGANTLLKAVNLISRTAQLVKFAANKKIDIAVSHNSYTHALAGRLIGARVVTIMDYEGQPANHLAFRAAHKVIVPKAFPREALKKFGAYDRKVYTYEGFKEQLYLSDYMPDKNFIPALLEACNLNAGYKIENKIIISIRTPPTMALYHHFQNIFFDQLLAMLDRNPSTLCLVFPRDGIQRDYIKNKFKNMHMPNVQLDGMDLCHYSDLVISAGGTMNREAAIIGTPAYSTFMGAMPAVDMELIKMGRMIHLENASDLQKIHFQKKIRGNILENPGLLNEIVNQILL
ncbi:MAG: DUF354 domain-containing protein [Pseudomonadota bacterium]